MMWATVSRPGPVASTPNIGGYGAPMAQATSALARTCVDSPGLPVPPAMTGDPPAPSVMVRADPMRTRAATGGASFDDLSIFPKALEPFRRQLVYRTVC